jgi:hypothetical protein
MTARQLDNTGTDDYYASPKPEFLFSMTSVLSFHSLQKRMNWFIGLIEPGNFPKPTPTDRTWALTRVSFNF